MCRSGRWAAVPMLDRIGIVRTLFGMLYADSDVLATTAGFSNTVDTNGTGAIQRVDRLVLAHHRRILVVPRHERWGFLLVQLSEGAGSHGVYGVSIHRIQRERHFAVDAVALGAVLLFASNHGALNAIAGIVGPRPERPEIAAQYEKEMPAFSLRLQVKAGLTGTAQVYGRYNTEPRDKLKMDLMYINKMSLAEDLKLIFATIKILLMKESTQGVEQGQTTAEKTEKVVEKSA